MLDTSKIDYIKKIENRFLNICFDFTLVGTCSKCDRLSCEGNDDPVFNLYYQKSNKE